MHGWGSVASGVLAHDMVDGTILSQCAGLGFWCMASMSTS